MICIAEQKITFKLRIKSRGQYCERALFNCYITSTILPEPISTTHEGEGTTYTTDSSLGTIRESPSARDIYVVGVPRENPCRHGETMQTSDRKASV